MPKPRISAKAVVGDLKRGLSDSDLMARYGVSERGLQSLFQKLLNAGLVDKPTLESRNSPPGGTPQPPSPRKISPKELSDDVKAGLADDQLMEEYGLTQQQLPRLFTKLIEKGFISQSDLDNRYSAPGEPDEIRQPPPSSEQKPDRTFIGKLKDGTWKEDKKLLILFLIFLSPVGLYGLVRTSRFKRITKILVGVFTALLVILLLSTGIAFVVWIASGFVIGLCAFQSYLRRRKRIDATAPALEKARTDRPAKGSADQKSLREQESGRLRNLLGLFINDWQRAIGIPACLILGAGVLAPFFRNSAPGWGYEQTLMEFSPLSGWGIVVCVIVSCIILFFRKYLWLWLTGPSSAALTAFSVWLFFDVKASKGASVAWFTGKAGWLAGWGLVALSRKKEGLDVGRRFGEAGGKWLGGLASEQLITLQWGWKLLAVGAALLILIALVSTVIAVLKKRKA